MNYQGEEEEINEERIIEEEDKKQDDDDKPNEENQKPQKKRKKVEQYRFKPEMITDTKKGLLYIYNVCKDHKFKNDELEELNYYMHFIEEWHYQIMPKYDFDYFTNRLQKFGGNNSVQTHLQFLRKAHKGLIPWNFITNPLQNEEEVPLQTANETFQTIEPIIHQDHNQIIEESQPQQQIQQTSQKKPLKLSLKKNNQQSNMKSGKKELSVRFNEEVQYEPEPQKQPEEDLEDIFDQLEAVYQTKAEKKTIT